MLVDVRRLTAATLVLLGMQLRSAGAVGHVPHDTYGKGRNVAVEISRDGSTGDLHGFSDLLDETSNLVQDEAPDSPFTTTAPPETDSTACAAGLDGKWYILTGDAYSPAVTISMGQGCEVNVTGPHSVLSHHDKPGDENTTVSFQGYAKGHSIKATIGPWDYGTLNATSGTISWSSKSCSQWAHPCLMTWEKNRRELPSIPLPSFMAYPSVANPSGVAPLGEGEKEYLCPPISGNYLVNRNGDLSPPITVTQASSTDGCAVTVTDPDHLLCQPRCPNGTAAVYKGSMQDGVVHVQISHYDTGYLQDDGGISWSCARCSWWTRPCNITWEPAPTTTTTTTSSTITSTIGVEGQCGIEGQCACVSGTWKVMQGNDTSPDLVIEQNGCGLTLKDSDECFCPPSCPSSKKFGGEIAGNQINMTVGYYETGLLSNDTSTISWITSLWFEGSMTWSKIDG